MFATYVSILSLCFTGIFCASYKIRQPNPLLLCKSVRRITLPPAINEKSTSLFVVGAFYVYQQKKPYFSAQDIIIYETFKYHIQRLQSKYSSQPIGALLYDVSCYDRGITEVIIQLLLGDVYHNRFVILAVFTNAGQTEFSRAANLLLPYHVPLFGFSRIEYVKEFELDEDVFPIIYFLKRNLNSFFELVQRLLNVFDIKEVNFVTDSFESNHEIEMLRNLKTLLKKDSVCLLENLETPSTAPIERILNETILYSKLAGTFFVYSKSSKYVSRLMNIVHELNANKTFTWILTEYASLYTLTNTTKRSANILFLEDHIAFPKGYRRSNFVYKFQHKTVSENPWLSAIYQKNLLLQKINEIRIIFKAQVEFYDSSFGVGFYRTFQIFENPKFLSKLSRSQESRLLPKNLYGDIIEIKNLFPGFDSNVKRLIYLKEKLGYEITNPFASQNVLDVSNTCDPPCFSGTEKKLWNKFINCCWRCVKCNLGFIRTLSMNTTYCKKCPPDTMSNMARTDCLPYTRVPLETLPQTKITCFVFVVIGILVCLFLLINFFRYRHTPIVKSSDANLLFVHLICHCILITIEFSPFLPPSKGLCYAIPFLRGFFWTLASSITFVKAQKFLYIFNSKYRRTATEIKMSKFFMYATIVFCVTLQMALIIVAIMHYGTIYELRRDDIEIVEYFTCSLRPYNLTMFVYIEIMLSVCMVQSYRARKLPNNFNETKYISVSVLCAEVFILSFMISGGKNIISDIMLMCIANISMVLVMYGYRMVIILFRSALNNTEVLNKQLFEMSTYSVTESMMTR